MEAVVINLVMEYFWHKTVLCTNTHRGRITWRSWSRGATNIPGLAAGFPGGPCLARRGHQPRWVHRLRRVHSRNHQEKYEKRWSWGQAFFLGQYPLMSLMLLWSMETTKLFLTAMLLIILWTSIKNGCEVAKLFS